MTDRRIQHEALPYSYAGRVDTAVPDRIAYLLISEPGGQDGMDLSNKGGVIVDASFDKAAIEKRKGLDSRYRIEARIVTGQDVFHSLSKLDKLDRLLLGVK